MLRCRGAVCVYIVQKMNLTALGRTVKNTVEPLKTDSPREESKCPSYKGVRRIEVSQNFHITVYMTL